MDEPMPNDILQLRDLPASLVLLPLDSEGHPPETVAGGQPFKMKLTALEKSMHTGEPDVQVRSLTLGGDGYLLANSSTLLVTTQSLIGSAEAPRAWDLNFQAELPAAGKNFKDIVVIACLNGWRVSNVVRIQRPNTHTDNPPCSQTTGP